MARWGVPPLCLPYVSLVATRSLVVALEVPPVAHGHVTPNPTPGSPPNPSQNGAGVMTNWGVPPLRPPHVSLVATRPRVVAQKVPLVAHRDVPPNPTPGSPQNPLIPPKSTPELGWGVMTNWGSHPVSLLHVLGGHQAPGGGPEGPTGGPQRCSSQPYPWVTPKSVPEWGWGDDKLGGPTPASPPRVLGGHQAPGGGPGGPPAPTCTVTVAVAGVCAAETVMAAGLRTWLESVAMAPNVVMGVASEAEAPCAPAPARLVDTVPVTAPSVVTPAGRGGGVRGGWHGVVAPDGGTRWRYGMVAPDGGMGWWHGMVAGDGGRRWWQEMVAWDGVMRWWHQIVAWDGGTRW